MNSFIILRSQTAAMRAASILNRASIPAQHTKLTLPSGCVFTVKIKTDPDEACRILQLSGIKCLGIKREDELLK